MEQYMKLIEELSCLNWMEDDKTKAKVLDQIYMISHVANWRCKHTQWEEDISNLMEWLWENVR